MKKKPAFVAVIVFVVACSAVYALSTGGPGGTWPKSWPKELEPLRTQAWTWQHEFHVYYDIPFGSREEVAGYRLSPSIQIHWIDDGDHDFSPRKSSGQTQLQNWEQAIAAVVTLVDAL